MSDTQNVPLATPDFGTIKEALKTYLKSQSELKDYNFEGSVMSVLIDTLSYNSHMMAFYLNMIGNESFLKTAVRRNSVVNNAGDLGYTPKSVRAARAILQVEYTPTGTPEPSIVVPKGTIFASSSGADLFLFNTIDAKIANFNYATGTYVVDALEVYEGKLLTHIFNVAAPGASVEDPVYDVHLGGIELPNLNVDTSIMSVFVDSGSGYVKFNEYDFTLNIDSTSRVYFISESDSELPVIRFGDDNLGYRPPVGSKIKVEYIVTSADQANDIARFTATSQLPGTTISHIGIRSTSYGGAPRESISSIKFNAVKSFESAGRGVTESDYSFLVKQAYPAAKAVVVWGGQDNDPPQYGKVFVSIQPTVGSTVPASAKDSIVTYLTKSGIITVTPEIVDPEFIYVDVNSEIKYEQTRASSLAGELESKVRDSILSYNNNNLSSYESTLRYSNLLSAIDSTDNGIISNSTGLTVAGRFYFNAGMQSSGDIRFSNKLVMNSVTSSLFSYGAFVNCKFTSVGDKLTITTTTESGIITLVSNAGNIDYETGQVSINPLVVVSVAPMYYDDIRLESYIRVSATPVDVNIYGKLNQIITIDNVTVTSKSV